MEENNEIKVSSANIILVSGGLTLTVFWGLNILKTAYPAVKSFLTFYKPIGPLLGLFVISIFSFFLFRAAFKAARIKNQTMAYWFYVVSVILFAFMIFPPIFEPIAHILGGN